jgi:hypothetical protein
MVLTLTHPQNVLKKREKVNMSDDLRHNMNLVIPGLNFWGDQNDAAKSVVDKTKWVMETAINRIEKLEEALREIIVHCEVPAPPNAEALKMFARKALEGKDDPQTDL